MTELKGFVFDPKLETEEVYFLFDDKVKLLYYCFSFIDYYSYV